MKHHLLTLLLLSGALSFAQEAPRLALPTTAGPDSEDPARPPAEANPADDLPTPAEPIAVPSPSAPAQDEQTAPRAAHALVDKMRAAYVASPDSDRTILEPASPLDTFTPQFRISEQPITLALRTLGRPHRISFVVEPDAADTKVSADMTDATVRECLAAITEPNGLYYEERAGYVTVRRNKTEYFIIDYPSMKRTSAGSVSVNLAASQPQGGSGQPGSAGGSSSTFASTGSGQNGGQQQQDQATLTIEKENDSDAWASVEEQLSAQLKDGESLNLNRFSGIATITASVRRLDQLRGFIALLNRRLNRQVHIQARVLEVTLSDQNKLGVDWTQALTTAGNGNVSFSGAIASNLTSVGPDSLAPNTFGLRIGAGKLEAVVSALSQQGNVSTESQPSVTTLANQTTYIKIGEDLTFFTLQSSTSINQPTNGSNTNVTSQDVYSQYNQTFGNVLEVTPTVSEEGIITLIASPVISRLTSISTSPDGKQSGPNTDSKATESIIRLRSGETGVMGGFVFTQELKDTRGVPLLSNVPLLGRAFRTDATSKTRTELVILITATLDPL